MTMCDKCEHIYPDILITVCYNFDKSEILGYLCDDCLKDWFKFEKEAFVDED